jgi:uncharacterized protein (TIGR01319 family)
MMDNVKLLIDIGSTFTKVVAIDLEREEVVSRVESPSTVEEDVTIGLRKALSKVERNVGSIKGKEAIACSSAAGGLRVVSIGLVTELSSEAAKRAALGAGAKIVGHFSYELTQSEMRQIESICPDLILLAGGTDGGNVKAIIHNASLLSRSKMAAPIVVAGNKSAFDEIEQIFSTSSKVVKFVKNVMPEIGKLEVEDCREAMREVFMQNIVKPKIQSKQLVKISLCPAAVLNLQFFVGGGGRRGLGGSLSLMWEGLPRTSILLLGNRPGRSMDEGFAGAFCQKDSGGRPWRKTQY